MQQEIAEIRKNIANITTELGITEQIAIVPATKMVEPERINELAQYGITAVGENRVQELLEKYDKVKDIEWHFIGALQTNKVKYIIDKVKLIHSVDRTSLADEIDRQAAKHGIVMNVLVEINVGEEQSKSGVLPADAQALMEYVSAKPNLCLKGVMGVFPVGAPDELYDKLARIGAIAKEKYGASVISAGMSGDYQTAIRHGANLIRPGSIIFGKRIYV